MPRFPKAFLNDILDAIRKIEKYTKNLTFEELTENELLLDGESIQNHF